MTIPWIKCSERMPPDDEKLYVVRHIAFKTLHKRTGCSINSMNPIRINDYKWIPFDETTWNLLNNIIVNSGLSEVKLDHDGVPTVYQVQQYKD